MTRPEFYTLKNGKMFSDKGAFMNGFDNNKIIVKMYNNSFINKLFFRNEFVTKIVSK